MKTLTFDFVRIPDWKDVGTSPLPMTIVQSLSLPRLSFGASMHAISCRAEPNPMGYSASTVRSSYGSGDGNGLLPTHSRPFHSSASDAIVLFNIYIQQQFLSTFSLIIHRKSLLAYLPPLQDPNSSSSTNESRGLFTLYEGQVQGESSSGPEDGDNCRQVLEPIPWAEWGPPVSRWIRAQDHSTRWITTSTGQRLVLIDDPSWEVERPIVVFDFNPRHRCPDSNTQRELLCVNGDGPFEEKVYSELPFGYTISDEHYDYDAVLMDEERVIGMRVRNSDSCMSMGLLKFIHNRLIPRKIILRQSMFYTLDRLMARFCPGGWIGLPPTGFFFPFSTYVMLLG